ncbi:MAG TPA: histidine kinase [Chitinophaga sp.]|uniref:sensor histidine kinase n=1 Tax=Chitinophaga sp. TaxID=1869181 RepID=UPI002CD9A1C3|nr:histidine kinase [Chitinophaga sp.]HVI43530.1 histidine kinase [Chitinophaga sp.]
MYKYCYIILTICILSAAPLSSSAQEIPYVHYTTENGLPSDIVYCVLKDSKGFLWFGTDKGLVMYNGIRFETFTTFNGAPDNEIFYILEDDQQRLWLQTFNGVLCYYKNGRFHTPANTPFLRKKIPASSTGMYFREKDSSVTVLHTHLKQFISIKNDTCNIYPVPSLNTSPDEYPYSIRKLSPATYQLRTNQGFITIDTTGRILERTPPSATGWQKYLINNQQEYIALQDRIITPQGHTVFTFSDGYTGNNSITHCYVSDGNVFITTTDKGLLINQRPFLLTNGKFSGITQDINGNYWLTTLNEGIYCIGKDIIRSGAWKAPYKGNVKFAFTDNGELFYADNNNNIYRLSNGQTSCIFSYSNYRKKNMISHEEPGAIFTDGAYHSLYGKDHITLHNIHNAHPRVLAKTLQPGATPDVIYEGVGIKGMAATPGYLYALQAGNRIFRISRKHIEKGRTTQIGTVPIVSKTRRIFSMAKDRYNHIWYNTNDSVYWFDDSLHQSTIPPLNNISFKRFYIFGDHLAGITHSNQLIVCSDIYGHMKVDTLPEQNCIWNRMYRIDDQHILLSSNNQYRILTLNGKHASLHTVENPFIPGQVSCICADSTTCYFFSDGTITAMPVNMLLKHKSEQRILFTHVKTGRQLYNINTDSLTIPYKDAGNITVSFSALAFGNASVQYEYSVSGGTNWQAVNSTEINLVNPGYGEHVISVRSRNAAGNYSTPATLLLNITRPYWATPWFLLLAALIFVTMLTLAFRLTMKYIVRKRELAHAAKIRFLKSEYKALNALMNPHFIFNSLNNIQGLINSNDKRPANEYLHIFSDLIRQNMHNISKELIPLSKEINLLRNYLRLEKLRFKDMLNYAVDVDEEVDTDVIFVPPLLIQPLVENAIRHGLLPRQSEDSLVRISIYEKGEMLCIEVEDNGIGISNARKNMTAQHQSFALENIRQRIIQLRQMYGMPISLEISDITGSNGQSRGTVAVVMIGSPS